MILRDVTLQNFRNVAEARLVFEGRRHFFVGANGQGKTNLLEALGYLTALRSFRTAENRLLVREGQPEAAAAYTFEHERFGRTRVTLRIGSRGNRTVHWDDERVSRLGDIIGRFPTVVFSADDIQLVRGAPGLRRRWMDLLFSAVDSAYFQVLQQYHRGLTARNALLRERAGAAELSAFEREMAGPASRLGKAREAGLRELNVSLEKAYRHLGGEDAAALLELRKPGSAAQAPEEWIERWCEGRDRDRQAGATQAGPHRDDLHFGLEGRSLARYGSEGQQRSFVIALRLAQADYVRAGTGLLPPLLLDDVTAELDGGRRERFWALVAGEAQVFATGVMRPELGDDAWRFCRVAGGTFAWESRIASGECGIRTAQ